MARTDLHNYPDEYYYPEALKSGILTVEEMRHEYSYLRQIANKRLSNLAKSEFSNTQAYLRNRYKFIPLDDIADESELIKRLYEVKKFTSSRSGSVTGQREIRKQAIETAHERGMMWLNKSNIKEFGDYMEHLRSIHKGKQFDSERAQMLFGVAVKKGINSEEIAKDFDYWKNHISDLEKMPKMENSKHKSAEDYKKALQNKKKKR